ncbi:MAG: MBL fold metallo-hydrolase [Thermoprotei archaeon]|nr:MBL fold metallo-hydrolase [Thermoprotei archaeon]
MVVASITTAYYLVTMRLRPSAPAVTGPADIHEGRVITISSVSNCVITVIVDNNPDSGLEITWGLSILVMTPNSTILFDTGPDPRVLKDNMAELGIDPKSIDIVVLSHEHGDHVRGLSYLAGANPNVMVYVPEGMSTNVKKWIKGLGLRIVEVNNTTVIANGIAVIGELYGPPYEEALAINVKDKGLVIVVGCSHPGVVEIVKKAIADLGVKPYLVIGGFHMAGASSSECHKVIKGLIALGVKRIAPIHCSGDGIRHILKKEYSDYYVEAHIGTQIALSGD